MRKWCVVVLVLIVVFTACVYPASEFEQQDGIEIQDKSSYILLDPMSDTVKTCLLFYPGGLVDPEAYVSLMQLVALTGCRVIIVKATADLAIFNVNRAAKIVAEYNLIENWLIGGHSLGGVVAIKALVKDLDMFKGLVLMAAYPAEKDDLSDWDGAVLSLTAENDGLTTVDDIQKAKEQLPPEIEIESLDEFPIDNTTGQTVYFQIQGGNHSQFGDYGFQQNDRTPEISIDLQHQMISEAIIRLIHSNGW